MYDELIQRLREPCQYENCILCQQAADAIEELTALSRRQEVKLVELTGELVSKPRWIPVTERLPEDLQNVLVIDDGRVTIGHCAHFYGDEQIYVDWHDTLYYPIDPPYWMPLPEPPKEET